MSWLSELCRCWGEAPALADDRRVVSYRELEELIRRPSGHPAVVATWMAASLEHGLVLLAALASGRAVAPLHPRWPQAVALEAAARIGADVVHTERGCIPVTTRRGNAPEGARTVLFSSGSTGRPRPILHTVAAHLASASASSARIPLGVGDRWLLNLPLAHVSGLSVLFRCVSTGACAVFGGTAATHFSMVPTQLRRALGALPSGLKAVLVGGGAVSPDLVSKAVADGWPVHLTYGLTEMASQVCTTRHLQPGDPVDTVGTPLESVAVEARDGRVFVRGPMLAEGVWDGGLVPVADTDGWLATSDLGCERPDGTWQILGRADRVLVSGGENVSAEQVELALEGITGIARCVVVAVADAEFGERPVAFVRGRVPPDWEARLRCLLPGFAMPVMLLPLPGEMVAGDAKPSWNELRELAERAARARGVDPHS
jgi:O-succinylbenzoic acid--CoA ligase